MEAEGNLAEGREMAAHNRELHLQVIAVEGVVALKCLDYRQGCGMRFTPATTSYKRVVIITPNLGSPRAGKPLRTSVRWGASRFIRVGHLRPEPVS